MRVIVFGATGMIGQGVVRAALEALDVETVLAVGRSASSVAHAKLQELVHTDFTDFSPVESKLSGYDACFFCLGTSAAGMTEEDYRRVTYEFALAAATVLVRANPSMIFVFVSGAGTDSTGKSRFMWARVKGETENALLRLPFRGVYMFRPAFVQPVGGERSRTAMYRAFYLATGWLFPVLRVAFPRQVSTTRELGRAMLEVARHGAPSAIVESALIRKLAEASDASV